MRFGVTKNKEEGLKKKMIKLAIDDKDIEEKFIRSRSEEHTSELQSH